MISWSRRRSRGPRSPADFNGATGVVEIDGEAVGPTQPALTGFVYPFNLTGHPALAVPSGWAADGLPTSVQIIGPRHADGGVLRLGALLEQARPWADRKPKLAFGYGFQCQSLPIGAPMRAVPDRPESTQGLNRFRVRRPSGSAGEVDWMSG